jgi:anti-sigma B factor antagonist
MANAPVARYASRGFEADAAGRVFMATHRRIDVSKVGDVTVVKFLDKKILDEAGIQELGLELFGLVEHDNRKSILLNFSNVEFLSSAALGKLITLDRKVKSHKGRLKMSNIRPEILEVFQITKLNKVFDIRADEAEAVSAF